MPSFFAVPLPKPCSTTSASRASRCAIAMPSGDFRSSARLRLLWLIDRKIADSPLSCSSQLRVSSPTPGGSTLMTSAPSSPRCCAHRGPARTLEKSRTLMFLRGVMMCSGGLHFCLGIGAVGVLAGLAVAGGKPHEDQPADEGNEIDEHPPSRASGVVHAPDRDPECRQDHREAEQA